MVGNLPPGVSPRLVPLEPDRRDRPLRAGGAGLHAQPAQGRPGLGAEPAFRTVPGVIDVTGFGGTVKQYQVLLDTQLMKRYDVTLQMVTTPIAQSNANVGGDILPLGPQSHNVRAIGYLGEGIDPLDPGQRRPRLRDRGREARRHPGRRGHLAQRTCRSTSGRSPRSVIGYQPRLGVVGRERRQRRASKASS